MMIDYIWYIHDEVPEVGDLISNSIYSNSKQSNITAVFSKTPVKPVENPKFSLIPGLENGTNLWIIYGKSMDNIWFIYG